jgi:hypothetical protein
LEWRVGGQGCPHCKVSGGDTLYQADKEVKPDCSGPSKGWDLLLLHHNHRASHRIWHRTATKTICEISKVC